MKSALGYFGLVCMSISASTTTATTKARPSLRVASARMASAAFATSRESNYAGGSRHLQSTCSSDAVTISVASNSGPLSSSNSLDAFAGCYQETGLLWLGLPYYTPSGLDLPNTVIRAVDVNSTGSEPSSTFTRWGLEDYETDVLLCASNEPAESIHPAEATWFCSSDDSGNELVSTVCGGVCEDSDPGETPCSSKTFFITSSAFPEFEGCYQPSGQEAEGQPVYSMTGELIEGEPRMMVANHTFENGDKSLIWNIGLERDSADIIPCTSAPSESIQHPSDASWSCDVDGDSIVGHFPSETADTPGLFDVTCGGAATTCDYAAPTSPTDPQAVTSISSDTPPSGARTTARRCRGCNINPSSPEGDNGLPVIDSGGKDTGTGGSAGLAISCTLRVLSAFVALVLATGFGSYGAV